ncbi:hypothetical protein [Domibacillus indicus]|uniref:hypothetical protein n=1 Tax=Domibacillus indicus TaxID=1437523 RepID=UPI000617DB80|nr:hypothetical protein [Domibacillus indicus]
MAVLSFFFAIGFAVIHFSAKYMKFIKRVPRSRFFSFAGGAAVSYVFVHLLPELHTHQEVLEKTKSNLLQFIENHAYFVALLGISFFYGLENAVTRKTKERRTHAGSGIFWIHIGVFFFYNMLIGYLLIQEKFNHAREMVFYFLALSVHFLTIDQSMRETHQQTYDKYGRWILAVAVLIGWGVGLFTQLQEMLVSALVAFLSGALILNVLKEELPEERDSSFAAFAAGTAAYSILLLNV